MNFTTLVSAAVVSLSLTATSFAQWSSGGINVGLGGGNSSVRFPNGGGVRTNNFQWGVNIGVGGGNFGGCGFPAPVYGGVPCLPPAVIMPYYGGGCCPAVLPYNPFNNTYSNGAVQIPCYPVVGYIPQVAMPY